MFTKQSYSHPTKKQSFQLKKEKYKLEVFTKHQDFTNVKTNDSNFYMKCYPDALTAITGKHFYKYVKPEEIRQVLLQASQCEFTFKTNKSQI